MSYGGSALARLLCAVRRALGSLLSVSHCKNPERLFLASFRDPHNTRRQLPAYGCPPGYVRGRLKAQLVAEPSQGPHTICAGSLADLALQVPNLRIGSSYSTIPPGTLDVVQ